MSIVAAINALDLFVITNSGNVKNLDPQVDIAGPAFDIHCEYHLYIRPRVFPR